MINMKWVCRSVGLEEGLKPQNEDEQSRIRWLKPTAIEKSNLEEQLIEKGSVSL
jgi:hypothetical protein